MKSSQRYLTLAIAFLAVIGGLIWLGSQQPSQATPDEGTIAQLTTVTPDDTRKGNPEASVVIVEYGDFQCPACATVQPIVNRVIEEYGDRVLLVFRHLPLTQIHPNAITSAWAVEAAGRQDKFFEMANVIYANQAEWSTLSDPFTTFEGYAEDIGINVDQFRTDYASDVVQDAVRNDMLIAQAGGLSSTPTFFLNGKRFEQNPSSYSVWQSLIEDELALTSQSPATE